MSNVFDIREKATVEEEAAEWLIRMDGDAPLTDTDRQQLREWMDASRQNRKELRKLAGLWEKLDALTELAVPMDQVTTSSQIEREKLRVPAFALAAALVLAIGATLFFSFRPDPLLNENGFYATAIGEQRTLTLPDQSTVVMNTNTQLKVDYGEQGRDIHLLQGEAHFDVAKNDDLPFRVYAGAGQVMALGTAFSVYLGDDGIDVIVEEGRVAIGAVPVRGDLPEGSVETVRSGQTAEVPVETLGELKAGQTASIISSVDEANNPVQTLRDVQTMKQRMIDNKLSWRDGVLTFTGEPLEEVVREIGRYTTVNIEFSNPRIRSIRIGGRFPVGETDTMFESLESTFGLEVTHLSQDRVLLSAGTD